MAVAVPWLESWDAAAPATTELAAWVSLGQAHGQLLTAAFTKAEANAATAVGCFASLGDEFGQAWSVLLRATALYFWARSRGDLTEARRHFERTLELRRAVGERLLEGEAINTLADFLLEQGSTPTDLAQTRELAQAAMAIAQATGAAPLQLNAHKFLHRVAKAEGDPTGALVHCEQAAELERRLCPLEAETKLKILRVRPEVEVALRELHVERTRARELQAALDQAELHRRRAVGADEDKGEVVRIVAHDLRNPVAAIRSLGKLLTHRHGGEAESRELCDLIISSADSALNMVSTVLDPSVLEERRMVLERSIVDLGALLRQGAQDHQPSAHAKHQRREVSGTDELICEGDERPLTSIVANLLSNALKYSPPDTAIHLRGERRSSDVANRKS